MSKTANASPELTPPVGPSSQSIEVGGFLNLSGQVEPSPGHWQGRRRGIVAETQPVLQNFSRFSRAAGESFDQVACARVFLTNMSDYVTMNGLGKVF